MTNRVEINIEQELQFRFPEMLVRTDRRHSMESRRISEILR